MGWYYKSTLHEKGINKSKKMIENYIRVIIPIIRVCKNWPTVIFGKIFNFKIKEIRLRSGAVFAVHGIIPKADLSMLIETWANHDYTPAGFEIKSTDLVIDIGANNGFFTIFAAQKALAGKVICFEPVPDLAKKIKENIRANNSKNITLEQIAVSNKKGTSEFYISKNHNGCHSLFQRDNLDEKIKISTTNLESYCAEMGIKKINFLKLDCEGAEYDIFNSLSQSFLKNSIEKISMEYHDVINEHKHQEIVALLSDNNFSVRVSRGYIYASNNVTMGNDMEKENINLASQEYWDSGYKNFNFTPMPESYPISALLRKHFPQTMNKTIFEIGIFPGRFIYHFGKMGYQINGIDQTPYLKDMENWFNKEKFSIGKIETGDILTLNTDKKYDVVFSSGFIEHFENFGEIIKIHADLTKQGGYVFITAPNFSGAIQKFLHTKLDKQNTDRHNLLAMDVEKWKKVLVGEGFDIVEAGYFGGFDFWVDKEKRGLLKKILTKILTKVTPLRFMPNSRSYSPEIILIAKKK